VTVTAVVMGVSGVGKSTVAQGVADRLGWRFAEGDGFHSPAEIAKMHAGHPLTDDDRRPWLHRVADWIGAEEAAGENAVITCSALRRAYRDTLREGHPSVRFVHLVGDPALVADRLAHRHGHFMPPALLGSQYDVLEPLGPDEPGVEVAVDAPPAEVVDRVVRALGAIPQPPRS
jgi:gluconokinase